MTPFARTLAAVLPAWQPLRRRNLPLWSFLGLRRRLARVVALRAEDRCAPCTWQARCRGLARRGAASPPARCPNAGLFA